VSAAPLISVVVPTFNRPGYLRLAIESVFNQSYTNWELIVADDGSDEATRQYLQTLDRMPRVSIVWLPHAGIPAAVRNAGVRCAKGEYVAFLDSDDLWEPRKLELQIAMMQAHGDRHWSYTAFTNVDEHGDALPSEINRRWIPCEGEVFERMLHGEVQIRTPCVMATHRLLLDVGAFDERIRSAEDYDLWYRLALRSEVAVVEDSLARIRSHRDHHSADWSSAYVGQDCTFVKLQPLLDQRRRELVRRERANNALRLASEYASRKNGGGVLRTLSSSVGFSWLYTRWWLKAMRILLRAFLPESFIIHYRQRHGRAA
jgi:glycosyltransferase involved in cell wall biosynthesis